MNDAVKSAKLARKIGLFGMLIIMGGAAWASYVVKGSAFTLVLLPAAFMAGCHVLGCELFVRDFKRRAQEQGNLPDD